MKKNLTEVTGHFDTLLRDDLIQVARGDIRADIVIKNGNLVNVFTKEIYQEDIAIKGKYIASLGSTERQIGPSTQIIDATGEYIMPGFIETHMHVAGSDLNMGELAKVLLCHGTTTISTDFSHIGIVAGISGIRFFLDELLKTPLKVWFVLPTVSYFQNTELGFRRTPDAPTIRDLRRMLAWKECVGIGETLLEAIRGDEQLRSLFIEALRENLVITGTSTGINDIVDLNEYLLYGCSSDHEMKTAEKATKLARHGLYVHIREGSAASDLKAVIRAITRDKVDSGRFLFCTDEEDPFRLRFYGHIDYKINEAIELGLNPIHAISIATINAATYFKQADVTGCLSPGKKADIVVSKSIDKIVVDKVIADGQLVVADGKYVRENEKTEYPSFLTHSIKISKPMDSHDFVKKSQKSQQDVHIIKVTEGSLISELDTATLDVNQNIIQSDVKNDIIMIAMVDRYSKRKRIATAFVTGFGLQYGALACSFSPMTENIMVVGVDGASMSFAVNVLCQTGGGLIAADQNNVLSFVKLNLLGLLSEEKLEVVTDNLQGLLETAKHMGCRLRSPFTSLGFVGITRLGNVKISPSGLFEPAKKRFVDTLVN
jgi:adenine deaminase